MIRTISRCLGLLGLLATLALPLASCAPRGRAAGPRPGSQKAAVSAATPDTFDAITPRQAGDYAARGACLLAVRSAVEWSDELGHLQGAKRIDIGSVEKRWEELKPWKDKDVVVYCRSGIRSRMGASILARHGFTHVHDLEGGLEAYRDWEAQAGRAK
jgi:rhodanese-related sulfurtransferase